MEAEIRIFSITLRYTRSLTPNINSGRGKKLPKETNKIATTRYCCAKILTNNQVYKRGLGIKGLRMVLVFSVRMKFCMCSRERSTSEHLAEKFFRWVRDCRKITLCLYGLLEPPTKTLKVRQHSLLLLLKIFRLILVNTCVIMQND